MRLRGFEPMQQEQMVLQYVQVHGHVTRSGAADLCQLSPDQAVRLLRRLVEEEKLEKHGTMKATWYGLPG